MVWWQNFINYWLWLKSRTNGNGENPSVRLAVYNAVFESVVDLLFYVIGLYTWLYLLGFIYLFFIDSSAYHALYVKIADALAEPYLGAVGIYVVLKEIRKRRYNMPSRHFGEFFVFAWFLLLITALGAVIFSPIFEFDNLMSDIITISLALLVIYVGGLIYRP